MDDVLDEEGTSSTPRKRARRQKSLNPADVEESDRRFSPTYSRPESRHIYAAKNAAVHPYHLPQFVDFSKWPNVVEWLDELGWEDSESVVSVQWDNREYRKAWTTISSVTKTFLVDRILPHVNQILQNTDGEWLMVAFTGLQVVLTMMCKEISDRFAAAAKDIHHPTAAVSDLNFQPEDALEELADFSSFFAPPDHRAERLSSGLRSMNFDQSELPTVDLRFDDFPDTPEQSQTTCSLRKRQKLTPENDAMVEIPKTDFEIVLGRPGRPSAEGEQPSDTADDGGPVFPQSSLPLVDLAELEDLVEVCFATHLADFTQKNVLRYLSEYVQDFFLREPATTLPVVTMMVRAYELVMKIQEKKPGYVWDPQVREDFDVAFFALQRVMVEMGLVDGIIAPALQLLCKKYVKESFANLLAENRATGPLDHYPYDALGNLLQKIADHEHQTVRPFGELQGVFFDWAKKDYIQTTIDSFFELLLQWPKSRNIFLELKQLIDEATQDVVYSVITSLQSQFHNRLLRPGMNTSDILAVYTAAIRALLIIDPSRVIQDLVCEPVRKCLRARPDTVRCIMSHITHISHANTAREPTRRHSLRALDVMIEEEEQAIMRLSSSTKTAASDIDMENWKKWQPDPIYAELLTNRTDRQADTIELLMSIYGGQEVFINEYQLILAEKLLGYYPFDAEEEARHLKMMTTRFGESLLQKSEVMSRDAQDSQKLHERILESLGLDGNRSSTLPLEIPMKTLVISHNYWPEIRTEKIQVPSQMKNAIDSYRQHFEQLTGTRTLEIRPELGYVKFDLKLDDGRQMKVKCNPIYAAIIFPFTEQKSWNINDLAAKVGIPLSTLIRKLTYWQRRNVLEEMEPEVYAIASSGNFLSEEDQNRMEDEEIESAVRYVADASADDQGLHLHMQMCWNRQILHLLQSSASKGIHIDRLFMVMKMALKRPIFTKEIFKQFMDTKIRSRDVMFNNGKYTLVTKKPE